ncbi:hypothetical protein M436DRAFT_84503 [Aureobasidium namibiae CBS 147.97]|uniref:Uncharacterized protein n=1 Tax=Aureobasidium namibiae CBS 147.97 TaxID=1043004 RepID=A0A074WKP2_9PEZI
MAQQQQVILEAVKVLIESGHVTAHHVPGQDFSLHLQFSKLDSELVSSLRSLYDQSHDTASSQADDRSHSNKIKDSNDEFRVDNVERDTTGFIDPWNTKTGNEPWWPYIEKATTDPSMLNKHPNLTDVDLLKIYYSTSSARERAKDSSGVFTTKGNFKGRGQYDYLREFVQKHPALNKSADGDFKANKRHRVHCTWNLINKIPVYTGFVKISPQPDRIVVGFTRASSFPPTYGGNGMYIRGAEAVKAWVNLNKIQECVLVSLPRQQTSSRLAFYITIEDQVILNPDTNLSELQAILDAAQQGQSVDLLSVGFDALTTHLPSLDALAERYRHLNINLVFAVPEWFPRLDLFPRLSNGVRYGQVLLAELSAYRKGISSSDIATCVEEFFEAVNLRKEHVAFATNLQELTRGRANFRVSPDTATDSGIRAAEENKEKGWSAPGLPRANRRKHRKQPDLKKRRISELEDNDEENYHDQENV